MTNLFPDPPVTISLHPAHRQGHKLKLVQTGGGMFQCNGCIEPGDGRRYRCEFEACNFDLHTCCALAPSTMKHSLFPGCRFVLLQEPLAPAGGRRCDACGDGVHERGLVYHCADRDLDLHPTCASLPARFPVGDHDFELRKETSRRCGRCRERCRKFWFYRSIVDGEALYLHVSCLKDMQVRRSLQNVAAGQMMQVMSTPAMEGVLQSLPRRRANGGGGLERFLTIVAGAIRVIIALIFGDPSAMIAAVAGAILNS